MRWKVEDLDKPQIMVESTFGDSHPGSAHLDQFVNEAMRGIADAGGKGADVYKRQGYLQDAKNNNMVKLVEKLTPEDCRKIYNHYNFACLKEVMS